MKVNLVINDNSEIPAPEDKWVAKVNFKKKTVALDGRNYAVAAKHVLRYSFWERVGRGLLGALAVGFSLGFSLFAKNIRQLFTKNTKASKCFAVCIGTATPQSPPASAQGASVSPPSSPPPSPQVEQRAPSPTPEESEITLNFYSQADQLAFWDAYLGPYIQAVADKSWDKLQGLFFLNEELHGIKGSLQLLLEQVVHNREALVDKKSGDDPANKADLQSLGCLKKSVQELINKADASIKTVSKKITSKANEPDRVQVLESEGLYNVVNSCYINSALQPLLAIRNFEEFVPDQVDPEPAGTFQSRQAILNSFKIFLEAWANKVGARQLGARIGELRHLIFQAGLAEGCFVDRDDERGYQDAGQFFELILHIIGKGFQQEFRRTPILEDGTALEGRTRNDRTPEGVFYLKNPGATLQEMVNTYRNPLEEELSQDNAWRVAHPDTNDEMEILRCRESQKIISAAPEILVVRVNPHVVVPEQDSEIDFAPLFDHPPENCCYELVGFSRNHHQIHWTSVKRDGQQWKYCNDDHVRVVDPSSDTFKYPANYMVYRKKEQP